MDQKNRQNGNGESTTTTDTNSDSIPVASSTSPQETAASSPNTRTSSPCHTAMSPNPNVNGIIKKSTLKAALSLDPSALYRATIPYEKIAFSPPPQRLSNPGSMELKKVMNFIARKCRKLRKTITCFPVDVNSFIWMTADMLILVCFRSHLDMSYREKRNVPAENR